MHLSMVSYGETGRADQFIGLSKGYILVRQRETKTTPHSSVEKGLCHIAQREIHREQAAGIRKEGKFLVEDSSGLSRICDPTISL